MNKFEFDGITVNVHCKIKFVNCFFNQFGNEDNSYTGYYSSCEDIIVVRADMKDTYTVIHEAAHSWGCCPKAYEEGKVLTTKEEEAVADLCTAAVLFATRHTEYYEYIFRSLRSRKIYCEYNKKAMDKAYKILSKMCPQAQVFFDEVLKFYDLRKEQHENS